MKQFFNSQLGFCECFITRPRAAALDWILQFCWSWCERRTRETSEGQPHAFYTGAVTGRRFGRPRPSEPDRARASPTALYEYLMRYVFS